MNSQRLALPLDHEPKPMPMPVPESSIPREVTAATEPMSIEEIGVLKDQIVAVLHTCFDPEIPVNIYELGLIYDITIAPLGEVELRMTLTSPACPVAGTLPGDVQRKVQTVKRVAAVKVEVVWDPPWTKDRMSEAAKLQLGLED